MKDARVVEPSGNSQNKPHALYSMNNGTSGVYIHAFAFIAGMSERLSIMTAENKISPQVRTAMLSMMLEMAGIELIDAKTSADREISDILEETKIENSSKSHTENAKTKIGSTKEKHVKVKMPKKPRKTIRFVESDVINRAKHIIGNASNEVIMKLGKNYQGHIKIHGIANNKSEANKEITSLRNDGHDAMACPVGESQIIIPDIDRVVPPSSRCPTTALNVWRQGTIVQELMAIHDESISVIMRTADNISIVSSYHKVMIPVIVEHAKTINKIMGGNLNLTDITPGILTRLGESRINIIRAVIAAIIPCIAEGSSDMNYISPLVELFGITGVKWLKPHDTSYKTSSACLYAHVASIIKYVSHASMIRQRACSDIIGMFSPHPKLYKSFMMSIRRRLYENDISNETIPDIRAIASRHLNVLEYADFCESLDLLTQRFINSDEKAESQSLRYLMMPMEFKGDKIADKIAQSAIYEFFSNCIAGQYRGAPLANIDDLSGIWLDNRVHSQCLVNGAEVKRVRLISRDCEINMPKINTRRNSRVRGVYSEKMYHSNLSDDLKHDLN